jgi:POT family proton-dependent oligopeptide transporter
MTTEVKKGHPKGLYLLFATEMWERFNFYGMRAILSTFLVSALAYKESDSALIYGGFLGLCYLTPMLGGFVSDRFLGNRNCIQLGGLTMAIGQMLLFVSASMYATNLHTAQTVNWIALGVIILGNGFFKPNISSMVGQLYPKSDNRLDSAFTIFYMGINLGAFLGNLICSMVGDVHEKVNGQEVRVVGAIKWGFLAAGIAMLLGVLVFRLLKNKYVVTPEGKAIGDKPLEAGHADAIEQAKFSSTSIGLWSALCAALICTFHYAFGQNWIYSVIYSSGISLAGLILSDKTLTIPERQRIWVIYIIGFFVIFFWACFEQAGSSLTFIAEKQTDRHILGWEIPPTLVQNANALFILIFGLPFSFLWLSLAKRNIEPISPVKQSIGLLLLSIGFLVMAFQVKGFGNSDKLAVGWLLFMYLFHTMGELCLSPIGLSLVSKLAPRRFASLLMGVFFLSNASGYALSGTLGALLPPTGDKYELAAKSGIDLTAVLNKTITPTADQLAELAKLKITSTYPSFAGFTIHNLFEFFMVFVILPGAAAILLFLISGRLKKMMHGIV